MALENRNGNIGNWYSKIEMETLENGINGKCYNWIMKLELETLENGIGKPWDMELEDAIGKMKLGILKLKHCKMEFVTLKNEIRSRTVNRIYWKI